MRLRDYSYVYNAAAHFATVEKYPGAEGIYAELKKGGVEAFEATCWALAEMARQGELIRRHMGETPRETPDAETFALELRPRQIVAAQGIVMDAIRDGLSNKDDEDEVDEVLAELQKKTGAD